MTVKDMIDEVMIQGLTCHSPCVMLIFLLGGWIVEPALHGYDKHIYFV